MRPALSYVSMDELKVVIAAKQCADAVAPVVDIRTRNRITNNMIR